MSTVSNLSSSVRARYQSKYAEAVQRRRLYDLFAMPFDGGNKETMQRSSSAVMPFLSDMTIGTSAISETVDITPQNLRDTTASITPTSRGDALQDSEKLLLEAYTDYAAKRYEVLGNNMIASLETLCIASALAGSNVIRSRARASLDAGTTTDYLIDKEFYKAANMLKELGCPQIQQDGSNAPVGYIAAMHPDVYVDLLGTGLIDDIAVNLDKGIWLNGALGALNGFQLIVSPFAKVFGGAGAANTTSLGDADTLSAAANALAASISITTGTNAGSGRYLTIGTEETGSTFYPMNERVNHISGTTTSVIVGSGPNGGLKYDHASGTIVKNCDSVYPVLFGGPSSLAKIYASDVGEFGEIVGPKATGLADQFVSLAWKWYGAYAIMNQNWLVRGEYSSSLDNI